VADIKRYVVGSNDDGLSAVLASEPTNVQTQDGLFWRSTLWATAEVPVDNSIEGDRSMNSDLGASRNPPSGGMLVRALELWPDKQDAEDHKKAITKLHEQVGQTHAPTEQELNRHPTVHRTDTLDSITLIRGEIYLVTDVEEVLMRPGDTVIIRGTNHGWSNRSKEPALLIGTMLDAIPAS
jgi:quercetin dioxygenase-like cupin family protein